MIKPFDLDRAKAGDPLVTRDGKAAHFIAHVPELEPQYRVIYRTSDAVSPTECDESGQFYGEDSESRHDLFMAPKTRTVYVQIFDRQADTDGPSLRSVAFENKADAERNTETTAWKVLVAALPVEIEA
jgi:hypothetical protein